MSIATFDSVVEFTQHLLQSNASTVTLIVCSTREAFIEELYADIQAPSIVVPREQSSSPAEEVQEESEHAENYRREKDEEEHEEKKEDDNHEEEHEEERENNHWMLSNTLELLSRSERIRVVFCPAIEHLRAYLGGSFRRRRPQDGQEGNKLYQGDAMLAIVNLVFLHSSTVEFSAQGLSRTAALAVEAAAREQVRLVLCECESALDGGGYGSGIWDVQVPLLNSITVEEGQPGGRTIQVKQVMKKWFRF
ncbi:hypothetical protein H112_03757 [Trichophyton rubrum D6]|uniref:Uncharacterized protein n=4 Tax=Trichophyton TaxID=5550 RepID=A0A178EZ88_TRIRU|nr:uncharacterized protein TERG_05086 [Trichophyton rubrum CBS 118892]EZF23497.1 hypothetical protein H100_03766 [Trichophyton rubrum MR850]EZF42453.1 hypothetical protein H102_03754 [Trichophyton rubrum CBS 100081]EZF53065.1 hypothetical protein H103_03767 [Trichophyton rubrum CBS 288.86]EZF63738.1 hypothetical protein H104_03753 [Trichophyton rubrum CBS 289.86]EZF74433.1 hypothetical protein H105_03782 [Trichophyton soudanense CBS 452.61]EZF85013.1 hypothetical protein H110_03759 [Trichophy